MADHWRSYEPITDVVVHNCDAPTDRRNTELVVTSKVDGAALGAPIGIVVADVCSLALTIEQADELIVRLSAARADAVRALVARRAGGVQQ